MKLKLRAVRTQNVNRLQCVHGWCFFLSSSLSRWPPLFFVVVTGYTSICVLCCVCLCSTQRGCRYGSAHSFGKKVNGGRATFFLWVSVSRRDKRVCVRDVFVGVGVGQGGWTRLAEWRGRVSEYIIAASRCRLGSEVLSYLALYRLFIVSAAAQLCKVPPPPSLPQPHPPFPTRKRDICPTPSKIPPYHRPHRDQHSPRPIVRPSVVPVGIRFCALTWSPL